MPKAKSTFSDARYDTAVDTESQGTDLYSSILHDPSCTVQVSPSSDSHKAEGKVVYYAIDVAADGKGEWRVYRRFKMFLKLQETLVADHSVRA